MPLQLTLKGVKTVKKYYRFLVIFLVLSCLVPYIAADTLQLYFASGRQISRMPLDGVAPGNTEIVLSGLEGYPGRIDFDPTNRQMYWIQRGRSKILRANLDGTNKQEIIASSQIIASSHYMADFAVDSTNQKIYWAENRLLAVEDAHPFTLLYTSLIQRANLDGTNIETIISNDHSRFRWDQDKPPVLAPAFTSIALDPANGKIYWLSFSTLHRANLDGTNIEELFSGTGHDERLITFNVALDTVNRKLYMTSENIIRRANLDATNIEIIASGLGSPFDIALDVAGGNMYWLEREGHQFKIRRANLDGTNVQTLISGGAQISGIALVPPLIAAEQITFSELMFATTGGLFSQPQWIELYNSAPHGTGNLKGSRLVIEARDSETRHRYSVIEFEDLYIEPNRTVLLVTRGNSRSSEYLPEERVYNLYDRSSIVSLGLRDNAVLPASGFALKLFAADGTLMDTAGNLDGVESSKDTPTWELPPGWTEDRARTSLIRRYEDGTALPGTEAMSWVRAADLPLAVNTYYGGETDVGTPGYRSDGPLPVALSFFRSARTDAGVRVEWTTASETDNAGFNILRCQMKEGSFVKVNPTLIPGAGTTAERTDYTWIDTTAKPNVGYYYRIEDVSFSGDRQRLATVQMRGYVSARGKLTTTWSELKVQD